MIPELLTSLVGLLGRIIPDKNQQEREKIAKEILELTQEFELAKGQQKINEVEAANSNLFVAGWRPCIGWVCGLAFAWTYLLQPILIFIIVVSGEPAPVLPALDMDTMMPVLFGLLGLGAYRSYEKVKGVIPRGK